MVFDFDYNKLILMIIFLILIIISFGLIHELTHQQIFSYNGINSSIGFNFNPFNENIPFFSFYTEATETYSSEVKFLQEQVDIVSYQLMMPVIIGLFLLFNIYLKLIDRSSNKC